MICKIKYFSKDDIIKRIKILYDRYHGLLDETKSEFWYMSCKKYEKKNILTLFQNSKQIYCNIDRIYDCSIHSSIDPNFDNPSSYDEIKYLKTYKKLLERSIVYLYRENNNSSELNNNNMIIDSQTENDNNDESLPISFSRSDEKKNKEKDKEMINNLNNNDLISNASSKILSCTNSKEVEENNSEIILENKDGSNKIIFLNKKKEEENTNGINNNSSNSGDTLKNHITELILEFNQNLKNLKCHSSVVSQIKRIKEMKREDKKPCSELCYKNFLICDENCINQYYLSSKDRPFPLTLELLLMKFVQMIKYDPCRLTKLVKPFIGKDKDNINYKVNCCDIYFYLLSKKYNIKNVIRKELFDLNIKERELSKKCRSSFTQPQIRKIEENNLKRMNLTYTPCFHFGNEICDEKCSCYKRGYCEFYCKCNQTLCKFAYHGCHCSKGDCTTNHCPCYINGRECNPHSCKNCNLQNQNNNRCKNLQLQQDYESKLIVGLSDIAGWGLFANEDIKKDCLIGEYKGELINDDIVSNRDRFKDYERSTYMFKVDDEYTVDSRRMGNVLRYANHSKINSNSYTKIVFSGGHRKIGLYAKKNIKKGEEILFDYDGQGILGKQFPWINNEKKVIMHNNSNSNNSSNNHNNSGITDKVSNEVSKIPKEKNHLITDFSFNNDLISDNNCDIKKKNDKLSSPNLFNENKIGDEFNEKKGSALRDINKTKSSDFNQNKGNSINSINKTVNYMNKNVNYNNNMNNKNLNIIYSILNKNANCKNNMNNNTINMNENLINYNEEPQIKSPIIKPYLDKKNFIHIEEPQKEKNQNLIDLLSDKNFIKLNDNKINSTKKLFKIEEEEDIKEIRSKYEKNKENSNVFDFMIKIRDNLAHNDKSIKVLNKKRYEPKFENKTFSVNNNKDNINNNIDDTIMKNNENKDNAIIDNILKKGNSSSKSSFLKEVKKFIDEKDDIHSEKEMKINIEINKDDLEFKLKKPIFVGEMFQPGENETKPKMRYNYIKSDNLIYPLNKATKKENNKININDTSNLGIQKKSFSFINNKIENKSNLNNNSNNNINNNINKNNINNYINNNIYNNNNLNNKNININNPSKNTINHPNNNLININNNIFNNKNIPPGYNISPNNNNISPNNNMISPNNNMISPNNNKISLNNNMISPNNNMISLNNINISPNNINNSSNNFNNSINNNNSFNNNNINDDSQNNGNNQAKLKLMNNIYNLGTIRMEIEFENPIIGDFSFFSPINSDKLRKIDSLKFKAEDIKDKVININFDKDICGYLLKSFLNKGNRIFKDYLDCFNSMAYYCLIPEINSELYIISKGPLFNQIEEKYDFNNGKNKKLLFIIKEINN